MKRVLSTFSFLVFLLFIFSCLPSFAQNDSVMNVHVNNAVAIPSKVLSPGDYQFRLLDSASRPRDMEVLSADGKTFYGIFPVCEASRNTADDSSTR